MGNGTNGRRKRLNETERGVGATAKVLKNAIQIFDMEHCFSSSSLSLHVCYFFRLHSSRTAAFIIQILYEIYEAYCPNTY